MYDNNTIKTCNGEIDIYYYKVGIEIHFLEY